jgi:hypothetical protein
MSWVQSFPPIISEQSKLLIPGSMPGEASLKTGSFMPISETHSGNHRRVVRRKPVVTRQCSPGKPWENSVPRVTDYVAD